jgi:hypothetical protein
MYVERNVLIGQLPKSATPFAKQHRMEFSSKYRSNLSRSRLTKVQTKMANSLDTDYRVDNGDGSLGKSIETVHLGDVTLPAKWGTEYDSMVQAVSLLQLANTKSSKPMRQRFDVSQTPQNPTQS